MLQVKGATKCFGGLTAVSNVDLSLQEGEIVGLIGPNGAGKTTMFNLISGNLCLDSGEINFKNTRISGFDAYKICRIGVARTFQQVKVFSNMSALQNVLLAILFGRSNPTVDADREAAELLEFVGLKDLTMTPAGELTMINQKRLELARALATEPDLLLLDEFMAGLTPAEVNGAMKLVRSIRDKGITILMVEHVMRAIMNICERIIVFNYGKKISEGTPEEIANDKEVIKIYLGEKGNKYAAD